MSVRVYVPVFCYANWDVNNDCHDGHHRTGTLGVFSSPGAALRCLIWKMIRFDLFDRWALWGCYQKYWPTWYGSGNIDIDEILTSNMNEQIYHAFLLA
jgi:hypothetical protein